jgi:plastocyanin
MSSLIRTRRIGLVVVLTIGVLSIHALATTTITAVAYAGEHHGSGHGGGHDGGMDEHGGAGGDGGHHGGDGHENAPTEAGARAIEVTAGRFRFEPDAIAVAAGEDVTIIMRSTDLFHDFFVKGEGHIVGAKAKKTKKGGLRIDEPGTYKFWCTVAGHRAAGMKGTVVVQ